MATVDSPERGTTDEVELARLRLEEMGSLGDTISHLDGDEVNVFGGIVGEEVMARVVRYRRRKKSHVSALVTEVLKPSPHRVSPPCSYFGACTGCQWQHIDYSHQLELKQEAVAREIGRYPELDGLSVAPTVPAPQPYGYRNHARFAVRRMGTLGFTNRISRNFLQIDKCLLMSPQINEALAVLQDRCQETSSLSIRVGANTGEYLVQPTLQTADVPLATGQTYYRESLMDRAFRVSSPSFFQVNTPQTEVLVDMVRERLGLTGGEVVVDAYAGVGTFAILLSAHAGRVIAIEESEAAVKDAAINTLGIDNVEYRLGRTEDVLDALEFRPDAVILDPPRVGCHPKALEALARAAPARTVYASCDPESLARDLAALAGSGFKVVGVDPVDMFPQTHHVECVATLTLPDSR